VLSGNVFVPTFLLNEAGAAPAEAAGDSRPEAGARLTERQNVVNRTQAASAAKQAALI
jgi:hypothetical protein